MSTQLVFAVWNPRINYTTVYIVWHGTIYKYSRVLSCTDDNHINRTGSFEYGSKDTKFKLPDPWINDG